MKYNHNFSRDGNVDVGLTSFTDTFSTRIKARNLSAFATPTMSTRVTNIGASDEQFQQGDRII